MKPIYRRYLIGTAASTGAALALVIGFNLWVDPIGAYTGSPEDAFAPYRELSRRGKAELAARGDCEIALLGSSRVETGIDPTHPCWRGARVYNLALPASSIVETDPVARFILEHNAGRLRELWLFLDYQQFIDARPPQDDFARSRFNPELDLAEYHLANLLTLAPAWDVWDHRRRGVVTMVKPLGQRRDWGRVPHRRAFARILASMVRDGPLSARGVQPERLVAIDEILTECRRRHVRARVVINPLHALMLETLYRLGHGPDMESWQREVVAIVDRHPSVDLWDFCGYSPYTREPVRAGEGTMRWFYEASHYTGELGDLIIRRISGEPIPDFGEVLHASTIEEHLAKYRTDRENYAGTHPDEMEWLGQLFGSVKDRSR